MSEEVSSNTEAPRANASLRRLKGCGCLTSMGVMAFGILAAGGFDRESWGSALIALLIGGLVYGLSGSNGFWERS